MRNGSISEKEVAEGFRCAIWYILNIIIIIMIRDDSTEKSMVHEMNNKNVLY
jgi:hypothetical protein